MTFGSWNKIKKGLLKAKPKKSLSDDPIETCEYDPAGYNSYYPPDDDTDRRLESKYFVLKSLKEGTLSFLKPA